MIVNAGGAELLDEETTDEDIIEENEETKTKVKNKSVNYGKISTAIGETKNKGIKVFPPDINKSSLIFAPELERNAIIYGLKGITRIGSQLVLDIIANRPYNSIDDFLSKIKVNKVQMIELIKAGAFDNLYQNTREEIMDIYINMISDKKKRITLQNMKMLIDKQMIPEEYNFEQRLYNFNKYLKKCASGDYYILDNIAMEFYSNNYDTDLLNDISIDGNEQTAKIFQPTWDKIYKKGMDPIRKWMKDNQEQILNDLNHQLYLESAEKYTEGNISAWEMDALGFYYHKHELASLRNIDYGIVDYNDLPEEPRVERTFETKEGQEIKMYEIYRIAGTVIDKDKNKGNVTLLTPSGVVTIKIWKNQFAVWDRQIFIKLPDGKKKVVEKSWFTRGNKLIITGFRRGDSFIPKKYKGIQYSLFEKIEEIDNNGYIIKSVTERVEV